MIEWIKKTLEPPGIDKPNRLALFAAIGEVMRLVKKDADTAFYAHFPYLVNDAKLEKHGEALLIPHLPHDTPEEYRNRVAAASFFLMRAGERGYIMDRLRERFGGRFTVIEEFMSIHTRVTDITGDERVWAWSLYDSLINPNIYIELSDWLHYIEQAPSCDEAAYSAYLRDSEIFSYPVWRNGSVLRTGETGRTGYLYFIEDTFEATLATAMVDTNAAAIVRNGLVLRNGEVSHTRWATNSFDAFPPMDMHIALIDTTYISDETFATIYNSADDTVPVLDACDPRTRYTPSLQDSITAEDTCTVGMRKHHFHNGIYQRDAEIGRSGMCLIPLA